MVTTQDIEKETTMKRFIFAAMMMASATVFAGDAMSSGEVKQVDKAAGKVTIKHGPLANLDMPGMTMVFKVKDPAMLEKLKAGEQIHFVAERVNGALVVTQVEAAK